MKLLKYLLYISPILIFIGISTFHDLHKRDLGTKSNPVKLYFTPALDADRITANAKELVDFLEKETGYYFETAVPQSYIAVVEAFGTNKCDIAGINTFSYLMAHEKYGAEARLRIVREGGETTYKGCFLARAGSGIDSLSDLQGRKIAYVDPSSTSGYILPKAILKRRGIKPSEEVFAMKHDNVVTMIYQKQVDAGAVYYSDPNPKTGLVMDARMRVLPQFPDVVKKVKIIGFTESIPNDPYVFRKDMPEEMKRKIVNAFLKFVSTPKGQKAMFEIADIVGLIKTSDRDYDGLRQMLKEQNISLSGVIK
ncbi:MAG: phosphate/phosphite/phosphonate ABC transporter substrate-binding protein [Ignavibacteria bacterium]|jgi:phosphonate transport system substrate-binding protein|nr:phosphate/phosphite/phosphonate ABC transporter substrate-binding protein [Ignavibacteria bacterium]MCU7497949.1 phosphate/phosphite/phosphonate ABC transporter substrate-binding protein [Ignavibacteria bacterium]MCU7514385.1 phosphate/phosphite/phosphonate ABC transporter substrate-binding protein [Ignavibacteria bacterium]MCU7519839.1 phosphate/phosphite/phosphonate ABC transporter substrate-binding protein [Ignavibacteria bacterium]MCU7524100.1 phosphate/phosphite/phosphonate ABC transpor